MQEKFPGRYVHDGYQTKVYSLRTSLEPFHRRLAQLYDKIEKRTVVPLQDSGFLPRYRQYTKEAAEAGIGQVVHLSCPLSAKELARNREEAPLALASILHRYLQEFAEQQCSWPDLKKVHYRFLMVDDTRVRLQGDKGKDLGRTEMRWALASMEENEPFEPVGFWVKKSWNKIKEDLENRLDYKRVEVFFSDGEPGIEEALLEEGVRHRRCILHGKRLLIYSLS